MTSSPRSFVVIVAATAGSLGIGRNGSLPWRLAGDMAFFKKVTSDVRTADKMNAVIMGRKTWQSIPQRFRPLKGRKNVVLSRNSMAREDLLLSDDVLVASSLTEALTLLSSPPHEEQVETIFVIGGGTIYSEAVTLDLCEKILFTAVKAPDSRFDDCDTHFPSLWRNHFRLSHRGPKQVTTDDVEFCFEEYVRASSTQNGSVVSEDKENIPSRKESEAIKANTFDERSISVNPVEAVYTEPNCTADQQCDINKEEMQYLRLVREILDNGVRRGDRTGTGTLSKFGVQMRYNLRKDRFPLLTTKRVFWRGVAEELLWFVSGCTNANVLKDRGIHIWDGNGSREFLDSLGLSEREEGDLGPVYGFQWRHFGAEYTSMHADYTGKGVDQLAECINKIKNNPEDRRIILSAWNPADLDKMALPPCHMFCQFYVADGELSCQMYQRSADMGLGVPFNIASYALLTRLVAQVCDLQAGDFVHTIGDAHVYVNHIEALKEQLERSPRPFPTLSINPDKKDIDSFDFSDFEVRGYNPHKIIKMKMAV